MSTIDRWVLESGVLSEQIYCQSMSWGINIRLLSTAKLCFDISTEIKMRFRILGKTLMRVRPYVSFYR
jgi:hypothetical protein